MVDSVALPMMPANERFSVPSVMVTWNDLVMTRFSPSLAMS